MKRRFAPVSQDFIQREQFRHQQIYCESPHNPEDVLCYGSDDDAYDDPVERQLRIEHQANRFLHGRSMFIASAVLHGPFDRKSGWENPWHSQNSVVAPSGHPHKRLKASVAGVPRHQPELERRPPRGSLYLPSPDLPRDRTSSPVHEYLDDVSFSRVKSWRDEVLSVAQFDLAEEMTPRPRPSSARTSRLSHCTPREPLSSQVVGDSFDSSRIVQPSSTQAGRRKSNTFGLTTTPRPLNQKSEPPRSERAVSSLRNYTSLATSLATTPARPSPDPVEPRPIPDLADEKANQPNQPITDEASSSDLSDLSQPTPDAPRYEAASGSAPSSSKSSVKPEMGVAVVPSKLLSAARFQEYSDRSFRFRGVAPRRDPGPEPIPTNTSRRTPVQARKTEKEERHEITQVDHAATPDRIMPHSPNHEENLVPLRRSPGELAEDSIVVGLQVEDPEAEVLNAERIEAHATHAACLGADGDASMMDGPTLIASTASSESELSDLASMGNFSCEKLSQALPQEMTSLPRKLLWPKSDKDTADTSVTSDRGRSETEITKGSQETKGDTTSAAGAAVQRSESPPIEQEIVVKSATTEEDSTKGGSDEMDDREQEASIGGGCTILGTPLPQRHEEQSPWRNSQIEVKVLEENVAGPIETEEHVSAAGDVSPSSAKAPFETKSQSPWAKEHTQPSQTFKILEQPEASYPENKAYQKLPLVSSEVVDQPSQSPWAKGDSQIVAATIPDSRLFNPLSSPAKSTNSPLKEIALPNLSTLPPRDQGEMSNSQEACPPIPSTPELKESSLPSPEYTHSIKSFREFLTPSPQKPKPSKKRRISALNDGQFPSTQALVDAAVSNPWLEPSQRNSVRKRKQLRVSWAPLPGEETEEETSILAAEDSSTHSPAGAELPDEPKVSSSVKIRPRSILRTSRAFYRASSPPPRSLPEDLPAGEGKFGKHFAAVASRRGSKRGKMNQAILPSASQENCDSPQVGAMAERFLAADDLSTRSLAAADDVSTRPRAYSILSDGEAYQRELQEYEQELQKVQSCFISNRISSSQLSTPAKPSETRNDEDRDSDVELSPGDVVFQMDGIGEEEDPVNDVMQNLDSFLDDTWGFGEKGASPEVLVLGGEPKSSGGSSSRRRSGYGGSGGFRSSGLTDATSVSNIWT